MSRRIFDIAFVTNYFSPGWEIFPVLIRLCPSQAQPELSPGGRRQGEGGAAAAQLRPSTSEPVLVDGGGGGYDIAVLLEEARPSRLPSPSEWMVSWGRQDEGKDSLGFFPLSEFCALSPEQNGTKFGKREKNQRVLPSGTIPACFVLTSPRS